MDPLRIEFQHLVVEGRRDAVFLFQVHESLLFVNTFVADFVICEESEQRMCHFRFDIWIFETIRIIANVAARLPADVTRCVARLSSLDEMSALIAKSLVL